MQRPGASPSMDDIIRLIEKSKLGYEDCSDASGGYKDLRKEVRNLHKSLRDLKQEFKDPHSEVNRDRSQYGSELTSLVSECHATLDSLLALIDDYFKRRNVETENLRLRQADFDQIGNVRVRLINCKMWVEAVLEKVEADERRKEGRSNRDEKLLDDLKYKMDKIADGVARSGESSLCADDMEEMWRLFQEKLAAQGVLHDDLAKYGSNLRRHLRDLYETGRLSRNSNGFRPPRDPITLNTSQWLDGIYSPPLSIDTINSASTDAFIKNLGSREENIKFRQAMKSQRAMSGSGRNETDTFRVGSWNSNATPVSGYAMVMVRVPEPEITTTDMILRDDFASERRDPARLLGAPPVYEHGRPRRASEEAFMGGSPSLASPIGSVRSSVSFTSPEAYRPRLAGSGNALRSDIQEGSAYGTLPQTSGASLFGSSPTPNISGGIYGQSPRASQSGPVGRGSFSHGSDGDDGLNTSTLQPDQIGRPIPSNAQWTKVNRRLISPEVLNGGGYRYEARENYVAILGVLSRDQLQVLAERTLQVRASRSRRSRESRPSDNRPTSRGSDDATPVPATFSNPPSGPSAFSGVPAQTEQVAAKKAPVPLKPILKNANKSVRFDEDELKGSDIETSETSTNFTTDSDTESSFDRRRVDSRDSRRARSDRDRDRNRDTRRDRDRDRDERHRPTPMGHEMAQPMAINAPRQDQYMMVPIPGQGGGRRATWENDSRGSSYGSRDMMPRDAPNPRGGNGSTGWSQKLTAGGIGAAAGTILSLATDVLLEGLM